MTVEVLNAGLRSSTSKSGKQRSHIVVESEALAFDLDTYRLAKPVAEAYAHHLREKVRAIASIASPATLKAREKLKKAYERGVPSAVKQFAGGRTGATPPTDSKTEFNHSGRFRESIVAAPASDGTIRVNVAGNRLSTSTATAAGVERIWNRLVQLVPEFGSIALAMQSDEMIRAQTNAVQRMVLKMKAAKQTTLLDVAKAAADTFGKVSNLFAA